MLWIQANLRVRVDMDARNEKSSLNRSAIPPYRVFFSWYINNDCNYKCSYCKPQDIKEVYLKIEKWLEIWQDIYERYGTCQIHISGGEPFIYPDFLKLIIDISKIHTLEFSTNFSWDITSFIENISPERARIGVSLHPEFTDFDKFLDKIILLKNAGFEVWVNYVGYPPILKEMSTYREKIKELDIHFSILPFDGHFKDRRYPAGYTEEEKKYLTDCAEGDEVNKKTVDWKTDEAKSNTKGMLCHMGQMYARIYPNTEVYRCCGNGVKKLGSLANEKLILFEEAMPCECEQCPCWKCMLVGKEENWKNHWVIPHTTKG